MAAPRPMTVLQVLPALGAGGVERSTVEIARWTGKDGTPRAQASTSVYEFAPDGRLRHVWYFNAQPVGDAALDDE